MERTTERLKHHYHIEKKLADKLRNSTKQERSYLYTQCYDEMFLQVPDHPQLTQKSEKKHRIEQAQILMNTYFKGKLDKTKTLVEVGPGDCIVASEFAGIVKQVYAIDVSSEITKDMSFPSNMELKMSDGCSIPLEEETADLVFSDQLMEHLHPTDALEQLINIYRVLKKGGEYICITPHKFKGPHDISKYFDKEATCFHLKEYTMAEIYQLFRAAGFSKVYFIFRFRGKTYRIKYNIVNMLEKTISTLPHTLRRFISNLPLLRAIFTMVIVGTK